MQKEMKPEMRMAPCLIRGTGNVMSGEGTMHLLGTQDEVAGRLNTGEADLVKMETHALDRTGDIPVDVLNPVYVSKSKVIFIGPDVAAKDLMLTDEDRQMIAAQMAQGKAEAQAKKPLPKGMN